MNVTKIVLMFPFRVLGQVWRIVLRLFLVALLAFNIALFTVNGFYAAASGALSAVGVTTAAVREAAGKSTKKKAQRQIVRETSRKVTRRVQRGAARSIASAAGEAIPFVGAGVVAGALALEVNDACDTARDMVGLEAALLSAGDPEVARQRAEDDFDCTSMIREELPGFEELPTAEGLWAAVRTAPGKAYEQARDAGIALRDMDWPGWAPSWFGREGSPDLEGRNGED